MKTRETKSRAITFNKMETVTIEMGKRFYEQNVKLKKVGEENTGLSKIYDPATFIIGPSANLAVHLHSKSPYLSIIISQSLY